MVRFLIRGKKKKKKKRHFLFYLRGRERSRGWGLVDSSSCMYWTFSLPSPSPEVLLLFLFLPSEPGGCTIPFPAPSFCFAKTRRAPGTEPGQGEEAPLLCRAPAPPARAGGFGFVSFALNCFQSLFPPFPPSLLFPISRPIHAVLAAMTRDPTAERKVNTEICSTRFYLLRFFCCWACLSLFYSYFNFFLFFFFWAAKLPLAPFVLFCFWFFFHLYWL